VGMRVDERVKVREGTERVVQVIVQAHR
jgi:hypothetical protein